MIDSQSGAPVGPDLSGERFVPEVGHDLLIEAEHQVRYRLAAALAEGRRVLDAGCGVGWGSVLLHVGGAARVTGVDNSAEAVADAARRAPQLHFVRADLEHLPFPDAHFDLVTCFEAIEHVSHPHRALDELRRVLVPTGLLLVSSPNPGVYRAGNPFHVHEFEPAELQAEVGRRFAHTALWVQHGHLGSALRRLGDEGPVIADVLMPGPAAGAMYSLVMASEAELPSATSRVALVSSRQIDHLDEAAESLGEEGRKLQQEWARMHSERAKYIAAHERIAGDLGRVASEQSLIEGEMADLRRRLGAVQRQAELVTADRDRVLLLLFETEQDLARRAASGPGAGPQSG